LHLTSGILRKVCRRVYIYIYILNNDLLRPAFSCEVYFILFFFIAVLTAEASKWNWARRACFARFRCVFSLLHIITINMYSLYIYNNMYVKLSYLVLKLSSSTFVQVYCIMYIPTYCYVYVVRKVYWPSAV